MGRITTLRDLIGAVKDKASKSKAAIVSNRGNLSLHLAVLRVTSHSPNAPPDDHHLSTLLSLAERSRAAASTLASALMDRLNRTGDCAVALKCLLVIHHVIKRGPFVLRDQLAARRSDLKLSSFRDGATPATWMLSAWVRFYARYLETLLLASIRGVANGDSIRDVDSMIGVIEEMCEAPDSLLVEGNKLLYEVMGMLSDDYFSLVKELLPRLGELEERLGQLSFADSVELACCLRRLEDLQGRLSGLFLTAVTKPSVRTLWGLVGQVKERIETLKDSGGMLTFSFSKKSESARFSDRVSSLHNSVRFPSGKYHMTTRPKW
ncbi:unnamed protein product [Cuscuta campestris]|uniref:ENTH domain-containing protein n=2 Tax=Cuscuta sect. Cleistogrammica TaxID=1824901 RepID=A0A484MGJ0_9ASTE|nr:hypothetical protein DM860_014079 [Cuscuta australis]VFQ88073.1 unnamed protein product [Cuscuta campestris]